MPTRSVQILASWCIAGIAIALALADVPPVKPIGMVLELQGELDHASQIEDIRRGVSKAKTDGARIVVLRIEGRAWRYDIARELSEFVASSEPPVAVFTQDSALGVALAGASANAGCWAKEGLVLEKDDNSIELVDEPKKIKDDAKLWGKTDLWSVLSKHPAMRSAMLDPRMPCWLIESTNGTITTTDAEPDDATRKQSARAVQLAGGRDERVFISTKDARSLGLITGESRDASEALALAADRLGLRNLDTRQSVWIGQSLEQRHQLAIESHKQLSATLAVAERTLVANKGNAKSGPAVKNMAGATALSMLAGVKILINELETKLRETPEIQRLPAPGQPSLITKRSVSASRWRSAIEKLHDRAEKLEKQAIAFRDAK